jgi:hypothetical protein
VCFTSSATLMPHRSSLIHTRLLTNSLLVSILNECFLCWGGNMGGTRAYRVAQDLSNVQCVYCLFLSLSLCVCVSECVSE